MNGGLSRCGVMLFLAFTFVMMVPLAQGKDEVNILRSDDVICEASSSYNEYPCQNVYDGNFSPNHTGSWASNSQEIGVWLSFSFSKPYVITFAEIWSRCKKEDQYSGVVFIFSDLSRQKTALVCTDGDGGGWANCDGILSNKFDLEDVSTSSLRLEFEPACKEGLSPGLRELVLTGYPDEVNILRSDDVICEASSSYNEYPCENVYDGNFSPSQTGVWASNSQEVGVWLSFSFSKAYVITFAEIWSRCIKTDQFRGVVFIFSDLSRQRTALTCSDGSGGPSYFDNCDGNPSNKFDLEDVTTTSLRLEFEPACESGKSPGLRELVLIGYQDCLGLIFRTRNYSRYQLM